MTDEEELLRKQLKEEAKTWMKEEYAKRFQRIREALEKQARETTEFLESQGIAGTAEIASQTQMSIAFARSELWKEVEFESFTWIEKEVKNRLEK